MTAVELATKTCTKCGQVKRLDAFYRGKGYRGGFRPRCKACFEQARREGPSPRQRQVKICVEDGCDLPSRARQRCSKHYGRLRRRETRKFRDCDCSQGTACPDHHPRVCVCSAPEPGAFRGQCGRCFRLYETNLALRDRLTLVRIAWRQFLVDEGVFELVTGQEVPA